MNLHHVGVVLRIGDRLTATDGMITDGALVLWHETEEEKNKPRERIGVYGGYPEQQRPPTDRRVLVIPLTEIRRILLNVDTTEDCWWEVSEFI